tara:strand:- start:155 stop:286 length:132 start_codon:yes stop_codon:yes gene_type:complete
METKFKQKKGRTAQHVKEERLAKAFFKMERMWQHLMPGIKLLP